MDRVGVDTFGGSNPTNPVDKTGLAGLSALGDKTGFAGLTATGAVTGLAGDKTGLDFFSIFSTTKLSLR